MRRNKLLAGAALLAALSAACKRAPEPTDEAAPMGGPLLTAPVATVVSPLAGAATGYTNDMQLDKLQDEAGKMGIRHLSRPSDQAQEDTRPAISYEEGLERTRETSRALESQRHAIDRERESKTATLPNSTPGMIPKSTGGAPIAAPDDAGPKDPQ